MRFAMVHQYTLLLRDWIPTLFYASVFILLPALWLLNRRPTKVLPECKRARPSDAAN